MHLAIENRVKFLCLAGRSPVFHIARSAVRIKQLVLKMIRFQYFSPRYLETKEFMSFQETMDQEIDQDDFFVSEGYNIHQFIYEKHEVKKIEGLTALMKDVLNIAVTPLFIIAFEVVSLFGMIVPNLSIKINTNLECRYYSYNILMIDFII
ncbi:MAG TPA: hypothetical protein P5048_02470 [Chlamydiales bacterium]|nr:hypothetical protein [Chlamydiales bacterium]